MTPERGAASHQHRSKYSKNIAGVGIVSDNRRSAVIELILMAFEPVASKSDIVRRYLHIFHCRAEWRSYGLPGNYGEWRKVSLPLSRYMQGYDNSSSIIPHEQCVGNRDGNVCFRSQRAEIHEETATGIVEPSNHIASDCTRFSWCFVSFFRDAMNRECLACAAYFATYWLLRVTRSSAETNLLIQCPHHSRVASRLAAHCSSARRFVLRTRHV